MIGRLIVAGILASGLIYAQRGGGGGGRNRGGDMGAEMPMPRQLSPLDRMEGILKLNKDQKKQVKTVMDDAQQEAAPVREQIAKIEEDIGEAIVEAKSQEEIDKATNAFGTQRAQMAGIEMRAFAKIYQILDKEQQPNAGPVFFMMQGIFDGKNWNQAKQ